jgi:uncharacterized protein (DUF305 family)
MVRRWLGPVAGLAVAGAFATFLLLSAMDTITVSQRDAPFDQRFIDMMVPHHEAAIAMAEIARSRATREELRALADEIIDAQSAEIGQLRAWRESWFGSSETPPMEAMPMLPGVRMGGELMIGDRMDIRDDVEQLRSAEPFDQAFIDAMIQHHSAAIDAARSALSYSSRDEIRRLAEAIIDAQSREIDQLREWRPSSYWVPPADGMAATL